MARFLSRALGRAQSIASRTGSAVHPALGSAGTWNMRGEVIAYAEARTDQSRLRVQLCRLRDNGGEFDGGVAIDGQPFVLLDLSETQVDALLGLSPAEKLAAHEAIWSILNAAMPPAHRTPLGAA